MLRALSRTLKIGNKLLRFSSVQNNIETTDVKISKEEIPFTEKYSQHRNFMPLYELWPKHGDAYIAPNATIVGEVTIGDDCAIMYNTVIRGDINQVSIGHSVTIGENCVIHTAASLPTGIPARVIIMPICYIGANCTLYSCTLDEGCYIGDGSVILEGAKIERGA